jgi:hypothetical protein
VPHVQVGEHLRGLGFEALEILRILQQRVELEGLGYGLIVAEAVNAGFKVGAGEVVFTAVLDAQLLGWPALSNAREQLRVVALEMFVAPATAACVIVEPAKEFFFVSTEARGGVGR